MRLTSNIQQRPISDVSKTILETDEGDTLALFTDRSDYVPVGRTKIRLNGDEGREMSVRIEALREIAAAIIEHADHLDQLTGHPAPTSPF
jgi:hypothetical protein